MKADVLFQHLVDLALRLGIEVSQQNLRISGLPVRSGLCTVHGKRRFILDKKLSLSQKNELLAAELKRCPLDELYIVPAVREYIRKRAADAVLADDN